MNIISFNVNGIRAIARKNFFEDMETLNPDIICLQETKATVEQVKAVLQEKMAAYHIYGNEAQRKGYSGTAIMSKKEPLSVSYGINWEEHDQEGRVITAEYADFYLITVYVPNSGSGLVRLDYRQLWDRAFLQYVKDLEAKKPVLICGDLNVAHSDIDLSNPKANYNKYPGYMQEEIDGMDNFVRNNLLDTFRELHPTEVKYSWWSYRAGARDRNIGWRIDYFLASRALMPQIKEAYILNEVKGSDHCPVGVELTY